MRSLLSWISWTPSRNIFIGPSRSDLSLKRLSWCDIDCWLRFNCCPICAWVNPQNRRREMCTLTFISSSEAVTPYNTNDVSIIQYVRKWFNFIYLLFFIFESKVSSCFTVPVLPLRISSRHSVDISFSKRKNLLTAGLRFKSGSADQNTTMSTIRPTLLFRVLDIDS